MNQISNSIKVQTGSRTNTFWLIVRVHKCAKLLLGLVLPTDRITGTKTGANQSTLIKEAETLITNLYDKVMTLIGCIYMHPKRSLTSSNNSVSAWLSQSRNTVYSLRFR